MAISIGLVYLWFGMLKFFPDLSPAEGFAKSTIHVLTFGLIPDEVSIVLLALWETWIGVFLIFNVARRTVVLLALVHIIFTFTPLLFFPDQVFNEGPLYLTLLGQYIIKNLVIIAALVSLLHIDVKSFSLKFKKFQNPLSERIFKFGAVEESNHQKHSEQG
ncbi:hypothetical protein [Allomuricauda sp. CAU 1633]|uniref:hypothetical protein n=1 Tax=Allomuricauda sp. CAU 1633 TaxID=2816036 RepID=UPI001F5E324B|nr:hypothetical protein [Muricauda sp. CAU 1633]